MDRGEADVAVQAALRRLTLLNEAAVVLSSTLDAVEGLQRVSRVLVPALADWCVADLMDPDGRVERVCVVHRDPEVDVSDLAGTMPPLPVEPTGPLSRVLRGAGTALLTEADVPRVEEAADSFHAVNLKLFEQLGGHTLIVAPLRVRGRVLGALTAVRGADRPPLEEPDLALVEDLAHRIALAVDNGRLHAETQHIAERLQRSLLPDLPLVEGLQITARYVPAADTAQVGGDWYDCFVLPDGDTALIIGDITGHDLQATVTMAQVRNMLRGIACDRMEPPARILRRLDLAITVLYGLRTATCVYALVKGPVGGPYRLIWSAAGHPPPLLVTFDGETRYLQGGHGMMLGVDADDEREGAETDLPARSTLLLYTDGLVERRGESLDHGLTRLRQRAAALSRYGVDRMCDELLESLAADSHDDVALLALRLPRTPPPA
ncbi:Serine phosphatase RsbU, regulator of sigma subunit [Actinacidiphila rubida]|uniref:protein-serine/threonine phosphatase n=2 Tax=Actinacidiphila rubida TaxID=310780 RepID=A0A1H8KHJ3_9ACTN|nr:GAF domain-containing SpoIIE family protein phosphatase [Actinacidiphila rubida]SEN92372.1 Serine phosphatase RsbU, regulator of sigma subunit [Actinacidiphila rubida]